MFHHLSLFKNKVLVIDAIVLFVVRVYGGPCLWNATRWTRVVRVT